MLKKRTKSKQGQDQKSASLAELIALHGAGSPSALLPPPGFHNNVVAYRCVRMIAEAAASVPLQVSEHGAILTDCWVTSLLGHPNPDTTGVTFFEELFGFLQTHGNIYLEKIDAGQGPCALFSLHPGSIEHEDDIIRYRTDKDVRLFKTDLTGRSPLLHLALWQPRSGRRGLAPLHVAGQAIHLHNAACAWNQQLIENAARPSGALIHSGAEAGQHLTPEQFDRLRNELDAGFSGLAGAGRPLLLDGGLDWRPMGLTPAEMDFQNLKNSAARDIALAFGVPPMLLGIPGDNTYSNYKEANLAFWRQTILPLVAKVTGALSLWLDPTQVVRVAPATARLEALAPERSAHLDRIAAADFLTDSEKRQAFGFSANPGEHL